MLASHASQLRSTALDTSLPTMRRNLHEIERISDSLRQKAVREADQSSQRTYVEVAMARDLDRMCWGR